MQDQDGNRITTENTSGSILSHPDFNFGPVYDTGGMQIYKLIISIPKSSVLIKLKYVFFNIGTNSIDNCKTTNVKNNNDLSLFTIDNGEISLYGCAGGAQNMSSQTEFHLISKNDIVQFQLSTQNAVAGYAGYLIQYSSE